MFKSIRLFSGFSLLCVSFFLVSFGSLGCGTSLPGNIELLTTVEEGSSSTLLIKDDYAYVMVENKLKTYDISKPEEPKEVDQADAFAGPHVGMALAFDGRWLVLVGKSGTFTLFSLEKPASPKAFWGRKTLKLPFSVNSFLIRDGINAMYLSPGGGTAFARVGLSDLNVDDYSEAKTRLVGATVKISGGGGAGIVMYSTSKNVPVRLYTGNKEKGQIDIWRPDQLEAFASGGKKPKPIALPTTLGGNIQTLVPFERYLIAGASAGDKESKKSDIEVFDLGRNWRNAGEPTKKGDAQVRGLFYFDAAKKLMITKKLEIWKFTDDVTKPTKHSEPELRAELNIRAIAVRKGYIFTAEAAGFRVYKFGDN